METEPKYTFIVDTNEYSGNFERHLCGFMTGDGGEYGYKEVDDVFHQEVREDHPLLDFLEYRVVDTDDIPIHSPVTIWQSPLWFIDGAGGYYRSGDTEAAAAALVRWRKKTIRHTEAVLERLRAAKSAQTEIDRTEAYLRTRIKDAKAATKPGYGSPYMSVGIFLRGRPTDEQVAFLKERACRFAEFCREETSHSLPKALVIEGFRLSWEVTTVETVDLS